MLILQKFKKQFFFTNLVLFFTLFLCAPNSKDLQNKRRDFWKNLNRRRNKKRTCKTLQYQNIFIKEVFSLYDQNFTKKKYRMSKFKF